MGRTTPDLRALVDTDRDERAARHECTPLSLWNFRCALLNFANAMGDRPVSSIDRAAVEEWMATRHRLSAATRRHNLSVERTFCQWLVRRGYLPVDPTAEIPPVRVPRYLPRALSRVEGRQTPLCRPRRPRRAHRPLDGAGRVAVRRGLPPTGRRRRL
jgi:site-specific recombinase XerC